MQDRVMVTIGSLSALYFGIQVLQLVPTCIRIFQAIHADLTNWPGPAVSDPDPRVKQGDQWLGRPQQFLYPQFLKYVLGVFAAFALSTMIVVSSTFGWIVAKANHEWIAFGIPLFAAIVGGSLYCKRALVLGRIVRKFLSQ